MRLFAIAAFLGAAVLSSASTVTKKAPQTLTFDQTYMIQLDKSNAALQAFWAAECTDPTLPEKAQTLKKETTALHDLFVKVSTTDEPFKTQLVQVELGLGFMDTLQEAVQEQNQCVVKPDTTTAPTSTTNSKK